MKISRLFPSSSKPKPTLQPKDSGTKLTASHSDKPALKDGSQPSGPGLKRADSLPVHLPSSTPQRTEVKPVRNPITRPTPNTKPPKDFAKPAGEPRKIFGITLPFQKQMQKEAEVKRIKSGGYEKANFLNDRAITVHDLQPELKRKPEYLEIVKERHPKYDDYGYNDQGSALGILDNHPEFRAAKAKLRNEQLSVPIGPTATRMMTQGEQTFLDNAFRQLKQDIQKKPFHMHGETAITGNQKGQVTQFNHTPGNHSLAVPGKGDKYHLHTHPPFMEPFTSSASEGDHKIAARFYAKDNNQTSSYVTNGKDVLHIQPHSTELVKLIPNPKLETKLGKFPEAFRVPDPQRPPNPFSNHEAPATYRGKHSQSLGALFAQEDREAKD